MRFLKGARIERITFDYAVTLNFDNGAEIRIGTLLSLSDPSGARVEVDPEFAGPGAEALLRTLHQTVVEAASELQTGDLCLLLTNGTKVTVVHNDSYEAWTFSGPGGDMLVALPGGGLAVCGMENEAI